MTSEESEQLVLSSDDEPTWTGIVRDPPVPPVYWSPFLGLVWFDVTCNVYLYVGRSTGQLYRRFTLPPDAAPYVDYLDWE